MTMNISNCFVIYLRTTGGKCMHLLISA